MRIGDAAFKVDPALNVSLSAAHGADWKRNNDKRSRLNAAHTGDTDADGDQNRIDIFGGRSFSIVDAAGALAFDSGDQLKQILKVRFPGLMDDLRSDTQRPRAGARGGRQHQRC